MTVLSHLTSLGSNLVLSSLEKHNIRTSVQTLRTRLNGYFSNGQISEQFVFGSFDRDTILPRRFDSSSDVDYLVCFNNYSNYQPSTFLNYLRNFTIHRYSTSERTTSHPTVVLAQLSPTFVLF